jgi:hypothetical protein
MPRVAETSAVVGCKISVLATVIYLKNHPFAQWVPSNTPSLAAHDLSSRRQSSVSSRKDHLLLTCITLTSAPLTAVLFALCRLVAFFVCFPDAQ